MNRRDALRTLASAATVAPLALFAADLVAAPARLSVSGTYPELPPWQK